MTAFPRAPASTPSGPIIDGALGIPGTHGTGRSNTRTEERHGGQPAGIAWGRHGRDWVVMHERKATEPAKPTKSCWPITAHLYRGCSADYPCSFKGKAKSFLSAAAVVWVIGCTMTVSAAGPYEADVTSRLESPKQYMHIWHHAKRPASEHLHEVEGEFEVEKHESLRVESGNTRKKLIDTLQEKGKEELDPCDGEMSSVSLLFATRHPAPHQIHHI
ncbi:hypothetical protein G7046_g2449 [Stylonectria norvegica]|nr:hypothetical protein G7046_g2449 [Stylonectria norvegica]